MNPRRLRLGLLTVLAGLAGVALAATVLAVLYQPGWRLRLDGTGSGSETVSDRAAEALGALPEGAQLTAFLLEEEPLLLVNGSAVYPRAFALLRAILEDARIRSNGRIALRLLDQGSSLVEMEETKQRLQRQAGETLILEAGGQRQVLRFQDLFETTMPTQEGAPASLRRQRVDDALGDAALRLARERLPRVGLVTGYGPVPGRAPFQRLTAMLAAEGYEVVEIEGPEERDGLDLLFVPGQTLPFRPSAEAAAREWVAAGRPLLLGLGAASPAEVRDFWNELLKPTGISFQPGLVCEPLRTAVGMLTGDARCAVLDLPPEGLDAGHPITRRLAEARRGTVLQGAVELTISAGTDQYIRDPFLRSGPLAWVEPETDVDFRPGSREPQKSRNLAVAVERFSLDPAVPGGRTVLVGSASLPVVRDAEFAGARDWLTAAVRWLLEEEDAPGGLSAVDSQPFRLAAQDRARMTNLAVLTLPATTLLVGFFVFLRRRR